jgi:hypothetical protein
MPSTPDRRDDRPVGSADEPIEADAPHRAVRETVVFDGARPTEPLSRGPRVAAAAGLSHRETVRIDPDDIGRRETVTLPTQRRPPEPSGRAPLLVAAGFATLWAALLSYVPVVAVIGLARSFEGAGGLGGAAGAGLAGWLLGHGVPIGTAIGPLGLAPLLLTLLIVWRLSRAGLHASRATGARRTASGRAALLAASAVGLWYAFFGALAAAVLDGPGTVVSAPRAGVHFFVLGAIAALAGAARGTDAPVVLARRLPRMLRHGVRTGLVAALAILAAGAACAGLSIALGGGQAADTIAAYRTGVAGQAGITLVSFAYGPNAVVWAAAYLLGPGFVFGTGSAVRLTEVTVGPLPTLPLLAGLPEGPMGAAGTVLLAVPVVIGMAAGWLLTRRLMRSRPDRSGPDRPRPPDPPGPLPAWSMVVGSALLAGPVAGVVLGALAWVSGGPLGAGRLAQIGPVPWQVALVATVVVAVSAAIGAALGRAFRAPRRP